MLMMTQKQMYETPRMEVIVIETRSIVCASEEEEITGTGMNFTNGGGQW